MDSNAQATRVPVCYGYGRHSTDKQTELTGKVQHDRCFDYYQRELQHLGVVWGGWHYDDAVSGRKCFSEREHGRVVFLSTLPGDHVVVTRLDRGFRKLSDGLNTLEQWANRGVHFHSVFDRIDTSTATGNLIRSVLLAVGQFKSDVDSERTKESIAYLRSQGLPYSASPPVGWRIITRNDKRLLQAYAKERKVLDILAEARANGGSYETIAFWVWGNRNKLGIERNLSWPTQVRHALEARALGYPKVGRSLVRQMYKEAVESGKIGLD